MYRGGGTKGWREEGGGGSSSGRLMRDGDVYELIRGGAAECV